MLYLYCNVYYNLLPTVRAAVYIKKSIKYNIILYRGRIKRRHQSTKIVWFEIYKHNNTGC